MTRILTYAGFLIVLAIALVRHVRRTLEKERRAAAATAKGPVSSAGPRAQHPRIDLHHCIGCGGCVDACPEGDVLAIAAGRAAIANPHKCIGHGLCAEACPVGAITIVLAEPGVTADMPRLTPAFETSVPGLYIVGELGGLALIKNAVTQGRAVIETIAARRAARGAATAPVAGGAHEVCIVGAGPAGISASLRAIELGLSYVTLEQDEFGGTIAKFPRQKLVLTSPVEFPIYGRFRKLEISKEELLKFWRKIGERADLKVQTHEKVESIVRAPDGLFDVTTQRGSCRARHVVLALGRRGTPRRLGIPGEGLPKVMYSLIDAEAYEGARILVVGGGDSAVEAAMGLALQKGNQVTLSYRGAEFTRIKERNRVRLEEARRRGKIQVALQSNPVEVRPDAVVIDAAGNRRVLANDHVFVFAGGEGPNDFLRKIGVAIGPADLTAAARAEAAQKGRAA